MSELFLENGHLSDGALRDLIAERLDETARLEAAEHLSFCDDCLVRYTDLLTGDVLCQPSQDLTLPVMRRLRQKATKVLLNRYTAAAAAVAIAGTLWYSGVFAEVENTLNNADAVSPPEVVQQQAPQTPQNPITGAVNAWLEEKVFSKHAQPQPTKTPQPNQSRPDETDPQKPGFLSGLFNQN